MTVPAGTADRWGAPVRANGAVGVRALDDAVEALVGLSGDPVGRAGAALEADPSLLLGRVLQAYLHLYRTCPDGRASATAVLASAGGRPGARRTGSASTCVRRSAGPPATGPGRPARWSRRCSPTHRDLLALKVAQDLYFYLGDRIDLRDVVARVLPAWPAGGPGSGYVQGMYAFGLEENAAYRQAERAARAALAANPRDAWAVHALAHVYEMAGATGPGLAFLRRTVTGWSPSFFAVHNWWHQALFHLARGEFDDVLALYDGPIRGPRSPEWVHLADAASLLWRLGLFGVAVGRRRDELADDVEASLGDPVYVFNDWHAVMALGLAGRSAAVAGWWRPTGWERSAPTAGRWRWRAWRCWRASPATPRAGPNRRSATSARCARRPKWWGAATPSVT